MVESRTRLMSDVELGDALREVSSRGWVDISVVDVVDMA